MDIAPDYLYPPGGLPEPVTPRNGTDYQLAELYELLGCEYVEMHRLPDGRVMVVDEEGRLRGKELNPAASMLHRRAIFVGTVLVCLPERLQ